MAVASITVPHTRGAGKELAKGVVPLNEDGTVAALATAAGQTTGNASLSVLDDWDESDRAKVNPIVGQPGVAAGAGATNAQTQRIVQASDSRTVLATAGGIPAGSPTYTVVGTAYGAYATPTDMITIRGAAGKTIAVTALMIAPRATAAALATFRWIKRSTLNTGGTATNPTPIKHDSTDAAAVAQIDVYTAAPTLGTSDGAIGIIILSQPATTSAHSWFNFPAVTNISITGDAISAADIRKPIILHENEMLCINLNGDALAAGFTAEYMVKWIEY